MLMLTLLLQAIIAQAQPANLARLDGAVAIADSTHRDRWGIDGYHAHLAIDGNTNSAGDGMRTTSWASDNWEVTHSLTVIFPAEADLESVRIHWAGSLAPSRVVVSGLIGGQWEELGAYGPAGNEAVSSAWTGQAANVAAVRIIQPPDAANLGADRRMWVAELEAFGQVSEPRVPVDVRATRERVESELLALRRAEDDTRKAPVIARAMSPLKTRGFQGIVNREDVARGRENVATRPWAKQALEAIQRDADWWVAKDDQYIRSLIPGGNPRAICPSFEKGCPIHGGARSTFSATLEKPYVWKCSKGGEEWFDGAVVKNPATGEDVVVHDDGSGWLAPEGFPNAGRRYYFVAAYRYYLLGKLFSSPYEPDGGSEYRGETPIMQLSLAYALTGEPQYAHKAAVMLTRLADLYPGYDGCVEGPSQRQDGYIGQTFERFLVQNLILCCDLIWDEVMQDQQLADDLAAQGLVDLNGDGRVSGADVAHHLQRNLLAHIYEYLHRLIPYLDGDFWMYEMTALAALANSTGNPELAAEALESDLGLRVLLQNSWFRDGKYIYDSTGYNQGNAETILRIAEWIYGFQAPPQYPEPLDPYHHPDYRLTMLYDFLRHVDCDGRVPQIGDVGGARSVSLRTTPPYAWYFERALVRLPELRDYYAGQLMAAAGGDLEQLRLGGADWWTIFHAGPPLEAEAATVEPPRSHLFDDSGIAILRAGDTAATRMHVPFTFSRGAYGHGHPDKLAINIFRYGYDFSADLGYPTTWTDLKSGGWEKHTASHCLVMLNEGGQTGNVTGKLSYFATEPACDAVEASCEAAYPGTSLYRRTLALVRDPNGEPLYLADIFRVAGARTRDYLFHSLAAPENLTVTLDQPADWTHQPEGCLLGEDVPPMTRAGYGFLFDLHRAHTAGNLKASWEFRKGVSQPDRYLLTRRQFTNCDVRFTMIRTGKAGGDRERAVFVFATQPSTVQSRRVIMLPATELSVGKPVKVEVKVRGAQATMTVDGRPSGRVDVTGSPGESGSVGLLHYYNYDWEYRDFEITPDGGDTIRMNFEAPLSEADWARIDPTYSAAAGALKVSDKTGGALHLFAAGSPGREVIRAAAEGYGVRGQAPLEGHLILRDIREDTAQGTAFLTVLEAVDGPSSVTAMQRLEITPSGDGTLTDCDAVAMRVEASDSAGPRVDYVLSALDMDTVRQLQVDGHNIRFRGAFGLVTTRSGQPTKLMLVGGGELACDGHTLSSPGNLTGQVVTVDPSAPAISVRLDDRCPTPDASLVGSKIKLENQAYVCPAVYTITSVEALPEGLWRLGLNMPLTVARGAIASVNAGNASFASRTPVMKLRMNPGIFNGKPARALPDGAPVRLTTATESAFVLADPAAISDFHPEGEYEILDVGVGDPFTIVTHKSLALAAN
ncbi:MAG: heparinase II/III family protein [Armatimonadetes bacterium]|nr:heparinase II/III family protein [Armatimonadota bacterium]